MRNVIVLKNECIFIEARKRKRDAGFSTFSRNKPDANASGLFLLNANKLIK